MFDKKKVLTICILLLAIPIVIFSGGFLFREKYYAWISLCVALLSCIPLFYCFEQKNNSAKELTVVAVMIALSVAGRFVFAWLPSFKPVTAITVIAAIYIGKEAGFAVGALSAVVSNFYFGQGPWTPFQMFSWGVIGFFAGLLSNPLQKNKIILCIYGVLAGVLFSLTMDIWTVVWADGTLNLSRYTTALLTSLPVTIQYAISNVVFLLFLTKPVGTKLERIKKKYGLFLQN